MGETTWARNDSESPRVPVEAKPEEKNMRKQRFELNPLSAPFRKLFRGRFFQFVVFFSLWNLGFYGVYKLAQGGARRKDPDFDNKNKNEQMLIMQGYDTSAIKRIKISISEKGIKTETTSYND